MSSPYFLGHRAGYQMLAPGLNPFAEFSPEALKWDAGWMDGAREIVMIKDSERRVRNGLQGVSGVAEVK